MERQQNHICNASCPGTANGHTAQWGFRRFCKDKSLEDEECRGQHRKLITTNWEGHQRWPSYNHTGQRTQCGPFYGCSTFQANWKGEKAEWVSPEPTEMKKLSFGSTVLFYATTMNHFFTTLWCATKSGLYTTTGEDQLSGWIKKKLQSTSQSQTCIIKRSWSLFGGLLPQLSVSWWNHYIWEVCSVKKRDTLKTSTHTAGIGQQKGLSYSHNNAWPHITEPTLQKLNKNFIKFCLIQHNHLTSHQPTTTSSSILTTFCRENASTTSRRKKMLPKSLSNLKAQIFMHNEV